MEEPAHCSAEVAAFDSGLDGLMRIPWGFLETSRGLTCVKTFKERQRRAELGEVAIDLLGRLGVPPEWLEKIADAEDPIAELERLRAS